MPSKTTMFLGAALASMLASSAPADVLFNNSNFATMPPGNGFNGANTSVISTGSTTFGPGFNSVTSTLQLSAPFTLSSASSLTAMTFFGYSTSTYGSPPVSPFTGGTVSIYAVDPAIDQGASLLITSTSFASSAWTGTYRVAAATLTNAQRPVFSITMNLPNFALGAGTYFMSFAPTAMNVAGGGSTASVFSVPVLNADGSLFAGQGSQRSAAGVWAAVTDAALGTRYVSPLTVEGTAVPEPSVVVLGAVGLSLLALRRRRKN